MEEILIDMPLYKESFEKQQMYFLLSKKNRTQTYSLPEKTLFFPQDCSEILVKEKPFSLCLPGDKEGYWQL